MNNSPAGVVTLAVAGLWVAYLVPQKLRHRQQLLESRTDDRFSGALRVLAVTDRRSQSVRVSDARARSGATPDCAATADKRVGLLTPGRGVPLLAISGANGGSAVDRPHGTQDRLSADAARRAAQHRAAHAAAVARRGAAARRRAVLAVTLLVASIAGWAVTGLTVVSVTAGIVPSVLFVGVLVLGRRAVVAGHAADIEWERRRREHALAPARASAHAPAVTGRAVRPSDQHTEVFARIDHVDAVDAAATHGESVDAGTVVRRSARQIGQGDGESAEDGWSPVPVPRPTYTLKSPAPRREPAPLGEVEGSTELRAQAATPEAVVEPPVLTTGSINLDEVLARRRAAGE
ncbi:MAG: hypothetical protein ACOH17_08585 [Cellulomonas sp.]